MHQLCSAAEEPQSEMTWRQILVDSWRLMESHGRPTIVGAIRIARECGARFNDKEARELLRAFAQKVTQIAPSSHPDATQQNEHVYPDATQPLPDEKLGSRAHSKVLLVTKSLEAKASIGSSPPAQEPTPEQPKTSKRKTSKRDDHDTPFDVSEPREAVDRCAPDDPSQPLWVRQMREWVLGVYETQLTALTADETLKLARYHAWRWANCTKDAAKNTAAAGKIVVGLTTLAADRRYGTVTVADYLVAGDDHWDCMGRKPLHAVWPIISQLEKVS